MDETGAPLGAIGNIVKVNDGPAAVTGDERCRKATVRN